MEDKGGDEMFTLAQTLGLMISFASLVLMIDRKKRS